MDQNRVVALEIRLLGAPAVIVDGEPARRPRGTKPWAVLAYVALSGRPCTRSHLAELLFSEAEDPLGALRWNLAAIRRLLSCPDALKGALLDLDLPSDTVIDAVAVKAGDLSVVERIGVGEELLAGVSVTDSPAFETWLLSERRLVSNRSAGLLREASLSALAAGDFDRAISHASRLVAIDEFDEAHHALLIRGLVLSGDERRASAQLELCRRALRPLGIEPGPAVLAAAASGRSRLPPAPGDPRAIDAQLAVIWQSFLAGSVDHAITRCRAVVADAEPCVAEVALVWARLFLASMLGMAVRGWDEAGVAATKAVVTAEAADDTATHATALGILAGTEMMRADYSAAKRHATLGLQVSDDPGARSLNLMFLAATQADGGDLSAAVDNASSSVIAAEQSGDPLRLVYALCHFGRVTLMQDRPDSATEPIDRALDLTGGAMLAVEPWAETMRAEIDLARGDLGRAAARAEHALAVATTTRIMYQQALALRVLALVAARQGDVDSAEGFLADALDRARRTTGEGYLFHWPVAFVLDSSATVSPDAARREHHALVLLDHATDHGMAHFIGRANRHLAQLSQMATGIKTPETSSRE
ncbi:hypothetical protein BH23ACT2_BH23ACT2_11720 [soil metagenome]